MLFVPFAFGNIRIGFEDRERRSMWILVEVPMALRDNLLPGFGVLYDFSIPAAVPEQDLLYFRQRQGKLGSQQLMGDLADRFDFGPTVESARALVPQRYLVLDVADKNVGEIEHASMFDELPIAPVELLERVSQPLFMAFAFGNLLDHGAFGADAHNRRATRCPASSFSHDHARGGARYCPLAPPTMVLIRSGPAMLRS